MQKPVGTSQQALLCTQLMRLVPYMNTGLQPPVHRLDCCCARRAITQPPHRGTKHRIRMLRCSLVLLVMTTNSCQAAYIVQCSCAGFVWPGKGHLA